MPAVTLTTMRQQRAQLAGIQREAAGHIRAAFDGAHARALHTVRNFADAYGHELAGRQAELDSLDGIGRAKVPLIWLHTYGALHGVQSAIKAGVELAAGYSRLHVEQAQQRAAAAGRLNGALLLAQLHGKPAPITFAVPAGRVGQSVHGGKPVASYFDGMGEDAWKRAGKAASSTAATGGSQDDMQKALLAIFDALLAYAILVAECEATGIYRDMVSLDFTDNPDLVSGWIWIANLGGACIACTDMHGSVHDTEDAIYGHVKCECEAMPFYGAPPDLQSGMDWFAEQDAATQEDILGPAKYQAWKSGDAELADFLRREEDGAISEASLASLGLDAGDYTA